MSIKNKVSDFISELQGDGENLFPYLANKDWKPGKNIFYSGIAFGIAVREFLLAFKK